MYLQPRLRNIKSANQMALVAYALTLAGSNMKDEAFQRLHSMRTQCKFTVVLFTSFKSCVTILVSHIFGYILKCFIADN